MNEKSKKLDIFVDMAIMQNPLTVLGYKNGCAASMNKLLYALTRSSKGAYSPGEMLEALDLKLKNT
jgi:Asp-tRNA(Asn)/Glu-tRNA(Gln) amidotransferase B subunit